MGTGEVQRLRLARRYMVLGLVLAAAVSVWGIALRLQVLSWIFGPAVPTEAEVAALDSSDQWAWWAGTVLLFLTAVPTVLWMASAYDLAKPRVAGSMYLGKVAMCCAWFIPILNFYQPYESMVDLWRGGVGEDTPRRTLALWWGLWLSSGFLMTVSGWMVNPRDPGVFPWSLYLGLASELATIGAAWLLIHITGRITAGLGTLAALPAVFD